MSNDSHSGSLNDKFKDFGAKPTEGLWDQISQSGGLQKKFDGFGAAPTEGLWPAIEAELDGNKRRRMIWWWFSGAAATIALIIGVNQLFPSDNPERNVTDINNEEKVVPVNNEESNDRAVVETNETVEESTFAETEIIAEKELSTEESSTAHSEEQTYKAHQIAPTISSNDELTDIKIEEEIAVSPIALAYPPILPIDWSYPYGQPDSVEIVLDRCRPSWELIADYSFWSPVFNGYYKVETGNVIGTTTFQSTADLVENDFSDSGYAYTESYISEPVVYGSASKPINLGLVAQINLCNRLSFYGGLSYSMNRFTTVYNSGEIEMTNSTVHSVGLPMGVKYTLVRGQRVGWNVSVGNQLDIPIAETRKVSYTPTYSALNADLAYENEHRTTIGYLSAIQLKSGLEVGLTRRMSLLVDGGCRWYYTQKINTSVPLIRKNFWLGGSIGISWDL